MKVFVLTVERADDSGIHFDAVPFQTHEEANDEAVRRVQAFKNDIVRDFLKDGLIDENKQNSHYCTANWSMHLYAYCTIKEWDI